LETFGRIIAKKVRNHTGLSNQTVLDFSISAILLFLHYLANLRFSFKRSMLLRQQMAHKNALKLSKSR